MSHSDIVASLEPRRYRILPRCFYASECFHATIKIYDVTIVNVLAKSRTIVNNRPV